MKCFICKGKLGLKRYKRTLSGKVVDVCSKKCQTKKLAEWGREK